MSANEKAKVNIFQKIAKSFRDMSGEMKRVVWPSKKQTINNTIIVIVFMLIMGLLISGFDALLSLIIKLVFAG